MNEIMQEYKLPMTHGSITFLTMTLLAFCTGPAVAQDEPDCQNAVTQFDMNYCANKDYEKADAGLNAVWKLAKKAAEESDVDQLDDLKGAAKALVAAQRGWIAYRDGQCELAGFEARGGSMEPMLVSGCLADMTNARRKELQSFVDGRAQ